MPYVNSHGFRIHYQVEGNGPPLICLHGFTDSVESWYEFGYVDALKSDYQLIMIDALGHGASDKPYEPEAYSAERNTANIVAVLDELALSKAHCFGYSMGARTAFAVAAYAPDRLLSLIIGGSPPYPMTPAAIEFYIDSLRKGPETIPPMWEMDAAVSPALRERLLSNDVEALIAWPIQQKEAQGFENRLPTLPLTCLVIVGEKDSNYASLQECSRLIPDVTFVSLPELGHAGAFLNSTESVPHIKQFLKRATKENN